MSATVAAHPVERAFLLRLRAGLERARSAGRTIVVSASAPVAVPDALGFYAASRRAGHDATLLARSGRGWGLVGAGTAHAFEAPRGAGDAARIAREWRALLRDAVGVVGGDGPVLLGGFAFDPARTGEGEWGAYPAGRLVLPRHVFRAADGGAVLATHHVVHPADADPWLVAAELVREREMLVRSAERGSCGGRGTGTEAGRRSAETPLGGDTSRPMSSGAGSLAVRELGSVGWWERAVARAAAEARAGRIAKVALARAVRVELAGAAPAVDDWPIAALARLQERYPECTLYAVGNGESTFLGATPERLVSLRGDEVRASALAGSRPRGRESGEDSRLGAALRASAKDRAEHEIVRDYVAHSLAGLADEVRAPAAPELLRLPNVQHLYTPVAARTRGDRTVLELAGALHPTPAVGGAPRAPALALIRDLEPAPRGWYAGALGWMDPSGDGEYVVAIRSALVRAGEATAYAGCGIVADSDPAAERRESDAKLRAVLDALGWGSP